MNPLRYEPAVQELEAHLNPAPARCPGAELICEPAWTEIARALSLSPRELEIVRGVFNDAPEDAIASDLHSSPHTVHTHLGRLHHKLGVRTRAQIILRVFQELLALAMCRDGGLDPICRLGVSGHCPLRARFLNRVRLPVTA